MSISEKKFLSENRRWAPKCNTCRDP